MEQRFEERVLTKLDKIEDNVTEIRIRLASLPHEYVSREEYEAIRDSSLKSKRYALTALLSTVAIIIAGVNVIL